MPKRVDYAALTERQCSSCRETKPVAEFHKYSDPTQPINGWRYHSRCRSCSNKAARQYSRDNKVRRNAYLRQRRAENPEAARASDRRSRLRANYGMTEEQVERLRATHEGLCWLCMARPAAVVDHDHATGKVRGMACHGCNSMVLGRADVDPTYLARVARYQAAGDASVFLDESCHVDTIRRVLAGGDP